MRRMLPAITVAAASVGFVPGSVGAAPPPERRGCPSAFELTPVATVLEIAAPGFEGAIRDADRNVDQLLCVKLLPEPIPLFEPTFLYYDNNRHP